MKQRRTALLAVFVVAVLTAAVLVFAGGCGGSSSSGSSASTQPRLYKIGEVSDATIASLRGASIDVVQYDPSMVKSVPDGSSFVLEHNSIEVIESGDVTAKKISECVGSGGEVVLISSDKSEREYLFKNILTDFASGAEGSEEGTLPIFAVTRETSGDLRSFVAITGGVVSSDDVLEEAEGRLAIKSGDKFVVVSGDEELGNQQTTDDNFKLIIGTDSITASGDTRVLVCGGAADGDVVYRIEGGKVVSSDLTTEPDSDPEYGDADENWNYLYDWLMEEPDAVAQAQLTARAFEAVKARLSANPAYAASNMDLLKVGQSFAATRTQSIRGKTYKINIFLITVHDFDKDKDWYYLEEECSVAGQDGYTKFWKKGGERVENYMKSVSVANELLINGSVANDIVTTDVKPLTINKETSHSETHSWSIGGKVGVAAKSSGPEASGELSFGVGASDSKSWKVSDVELKYIGGSNSPAWKYTYSNLPADDKKAGRWNRMKEAADTDLSRTTFVFYNFWVWGVDSDKRSGNPTLKVTPSLVTGRTWTRGNGSLECGRKEVAATGTPVTLQLNTLAAPLLALDTHNVDMTSKAEQQKYITVASKGAWQAKVASGGEWCTVTATSDRLLVETSENNSGAARTTKIEVTRTGTNDKQVITVIQPRTAK